MKLTIGAAATAMLATAAIAEPISSADLEQMRSNCVSSCTPNKPPSECQALCDCATAKIQANWTAEDLKAAAEAERSGQSDRAHFKRVVAECKREAGG